MKMTYLKVGVALTASFAFGFVLGQAVLLRKVEQLVEEKRTDLEAVKEELKAQMELTVEIPIEPEEEEDDEMALRRKKKAETPLEPFLRALDIPAEVYQTMDGKPIKGEKLMTVEAAERVVQINDLFAEEATRDILNAVVRLQKSKSPMVADDVTPYVYDIPKDARRMPFVYDNTNGMLWWEENTRFSREENFDILLYLMTFSVRRVKEDGEILLTTYSPLQLIDDLSIHLPDDMVEMRNSRIFYFKDSNIVAEIAIEEEPPTTGRIKMFVGAYDEE